MSTGKRSDPLMGFRFIVEIDGIAVARASEVSGIQVEIETETYEEGGVNDFVYQLPKRARYQPIVLKRGLAEGDEFWQWHQDCVNGSVKRKNGSIILLDTEGQEKWRWNFVQAFPVKWTGPDLKAENASVAFESIELAHHGIRKG